MPNDYYHCAPTHLLGARPTGCHSPHSRPSYQHAPSKPPSTDRLDSTLLQVRAEASTIKDFFFFFFFWRNDQTRGWGQNFLQETASPRLTVNKCSLLAALPSTVRALAPIVFQVQTGKGRKESEMADRRFNLLLLQLSLVGCLQFSRAASCLELPLHPTFPVNLPNCVPWAGSPRGQHTTGCPKAKGRSASQDQICRLRPMGWLET
jgi:hypothetical protein